MNIKELRTASGFSQKAFAEYFGIPKRSVENWESEARHCPAYLVDLIEYKLRNEGFLEWEPPLAHYALGGLTEEIKKDGHC
jgi:transcriptional regulator with XRE-family HTH domain